MDTPETRYAKTDDGVHIAYQTLGDGPNDVVFLPYVPGMEVAWDEPTLAHVLRRLAEVRRLVLCESRGVGSSDPTALPSPEAWMDDLRVVLDAVDSTNVSFVCHGGGGLFGMLFAATYPERTGALVLVDAYARAAAAEDYPMGLAPEVCDEIVASAERNFGMGGLAGFLAPSRAHDEGFRRLMAHWERTAFSPATISAVTRWSLDFDLRSVLPTIRVPTLVMHHHRHSGMYPVAFSEYLAEHVPGARLKLLPGSDVYYFSDTADEVVDEIEEFITGVPPVREPDRAFATVLFTDVVNSTPKVNELGDRKWRQLLDQHDRLVARELDRHRGRKVNTTGDGMLATFDGPARAVRCAQAIVETVRPLGIELRAGLHAGEVELRGDDIGGIAVHIGHRVSALAGPSEVLVSRTVTDLVAGSGLQFDERGEHELKGLPGKWAIYAVRS